VSLSLYRRHRSTCRYRHDRISKKCKKCLWWATGTLEGQPYRKSLKTRSHARAKQLLTQIENGNKPKEEPKSITIKDALAAFEKDCQARNLNPSTLSKYRLLASRLRDYASHQRIERLDQFTHAHALGFRASWTGSPRTLSKTIERLRAFFKFCVENDWLKKSPAQSIKTPQVRDNPTLPLSDAEVAKLMAHMEHRTQVFFRVLLQSGIRIIDAAQLTPQKIIDGKLFLYTQKTGTPVMLPLPPDLLHDLSQLPLTGGFFFAVQSTAPVSIAERYRQKLNQAAIKAGLGKKKVKGTPRGKNVVHPHRFRDTFAVRLLEKGVPLETVSILLGHTDIQTTQKSYAPWVKSLQDNLELAVQKTWTSKLALVKK